MIKQYIFTLLATLFFTQAGNAQSTGTFTDLRDGQTYKTISFKNALTGTTVTWMAQNLNYKVQGSYAYDDKGAIEKSWACFTPGKQRKKPAPKVGI